MCSKAATLRSNLAEIYGKNMFTRFSVINEEDVDQRTKYIVSQIRNAFFTPKELAKHLVLISGIMLDNNKHIKILEPNAGLGSIVDVLLSYKNADSFNIDANDFAPDMAYTLKIKYGDRINVYSGDIMKSKVKNVYDYIFCNPPFNVLNPNPPPKTLNDIDFIAHYYNMLKPNGIMCAIISDSFKSNSNSKYKKFKEHLNHLNAMVSDVDWAEAVKEQNDYPKEMKTNIN